MSIRFAMGASRVRLHLVTLQLLALLYGPSALADPLPAGTYQETCRGIAANGAALTAECKNREGDWRGTRLDNYHQCDSGIENHDGNLHCNRGRAAPGGSYTATCRDIWVQGDTLHASCKDRDGNWRDTLLANVQTCSGAISNQAGLLRCDRGGHVPGGPYQSSCRDFWMDGSSLHASCKDIHGAWHDTHLNTNGCTRQIDNIDGMLSCPHGNAPSGTYLDSCRDINANGNQLTAHCRTRSGSYVSASFDLTRSCVNGVYNADGALTCVKGGNAPSGSYFDSCRDIEVTATGLSAACRSKAGAWRQTSLADTGACAGIDNLDGTLVCRPRVTQGPPPERLPEQTTLCCGSPAPDGYIMVDRQWNPAIGSSCPTQFSSDVPNQCFYQRYDNKPINSRMVVCSSAPTPSGWIRGMPFESTTTCPAGRAAVDHKSLTEITHVSGPVASRSSPFQPAERARVHPDSAVGRHRQIEPDNLRRHSATEEKR